MVNKTSWNQVETEAMSAGLRRQMLNGKKVSLGRMRFESGTKVPVHKHANEQITIVVSGTLLGAAFRATHKSAGDRMRF